MTVTDAAGLKKPGEVSMLSLLDLSLLQLRGWGQEVVNKW